MNHYLTGRGEEMLTDNNAVLFCNFLLTFLFNLLSSVQSLSHVQLFVTPWTAGFPVHHQLPELTQTHVH